MNINESDRYDRRTFVAAIGAAGAMAVAGCADNGTDDNTTDSGAGDDDGFGDDDDGVEDDDGTTEPGEEDDDGTTEPGEEDDEDSVGDDDEHELTVRVMDSEGEPVEGASIEVEDEDGEGTGDGMVETDGDGEAMFELADGMYTVSAQADEFADGEEEVMIDGADEEVEIELEDDDGGI